MGSWFTPDSIIVTGGSSTIALNASTAPFTVELPDVADGVNTITITATHGTINVSVSGQISGNNTSNVVVTPDPGSPFTFSLLGTSNGDALITLANTFGWTNPDEIEVFVGQGTSDYATFSDLEDWYGVDNITIYSDLQNSGTRDFDRIQKWLTKAADKINLAFKRVGRTTPIPNTEADFSALSDVAAEYAGAMLAMSRGGLPGGAGFSTQDEFEKVMGWHIKHAMDELNSLVFLWSENSSDSAAVSTAGAITAVVGAPKQYPGTGSVRPPAITVPSLTGDVSW